MQLKLKLRNEQIDAYNEKNKILAQVGDEVSQNEFYRYIFPVGSFEHKEGKKKNNEYEQNKANGLLLIIENKRKEHRTRALHHLIFDDLKAIKKHSDKLFVVTSPIAYFGDRRTMKNASMLYAFTFDLDYVSIKNCLNLKRIIENNRGEHEDEGHFMDRIFPTPTFLVNSGTGVHFYYVLDKPIPLYKSNHKKLNDFKKAFLINVWNNYTTTEPRNPQYQNIFQGFRVVGSRTKLGVPYKVKAFKMGDRVSIEKLNKFVREEYQLKNLNYESNLTLEQAKEKYPKWYQKRIIENAPKGRWVTHRGLYDWWLNKIRTDEDLRVGHRYFCLMCLSIYAKKCNIDYEELQKDALSLFDYFNSMQNDFTLDDIESALCSYQDSFVTFPRNEIEKISGLSVPQNKRNGRKQKQHLERARAVQEIDYPNGEWRQGNGRKNKKEQVIMWRQEHPNGKKIECEKETGLSRHTVLKWWDYKDNTLRIKIEPSEEMLKYFGL